MSDENKPNRREFIQAGLAAAGLGLAARAGFADEIPDPTGKPPVPAAQGPLKGVSDVVYFEGTAEAVAADKEQLTRLANAQVAIMDKTAMNDYAQAFLEYGTKKNFVRADRIEVDLANKDAAINEIKEAKDDGFNGVYLVGAPDGKDAAKTQAFVDVVDAARDQGMYVMVNRGYEVLDKIADKVQAVVATDGYGKGDPADLNYTAKMVENARRAKLPVFAVEKADGADAQKVRDFYAKAGTTATYVTPDFNIVTEQPKVGVQPGGPK